MIITKIDELIWFRLGQIAPKAAKAAGVGVRKAPTVEEEELWRKLTRGQRKEIDEKAVFMSFLYETKLVSDPFRCSNQAPPKPDLSIEIENNKYYFELGEITDETLAKSVAESIREKTCSVCALSQVEPLAKMLKQKCEKSYETDSAQVDLLLYYWRQTPYPNTVHGHLDSNRDEVDELVRNSQFKKIWIYDLPSEEVVRKIAN
jgi:hypothetical protein